MPITIDIEVGDTILTGRFKNKKVEVKEIGKDDYGMPTINGRTIVTFRPSVKPQDKKENINKILNKMTKDKNVQ